MRAPASDGLAINVVTPAIQADFFTAGMLGILEHANGLTERGHTVRIVSGALTFRPRWIELKAELVDPARPLSPRQLLPEVARLAGGRLRAAARRGAATEGAPVTSLLLRLGPHASSTAVQQGAAFERLRRTMPPADVTIATSWDTVLPVHLYGRGRRVHFMQHFEVFHADDFEDPALAAAAADLGYRLPFARIANVGWLADHVAREYEHERPAVCWPGLDHRTFRVRGPSPDGPFAVLTSGGGQRRWKGFSEAAEAIRKAREEIPDLRWRVYGGALLPPDNDIAPYEDLGFVQHERLPHLYSTSHVTLSPSWYEGFSYPGLEAMACGSVLVTTPRAADDLARDRENARVVPERDAGAMARALVDLWREPAERAALRERALADAREFTWTRSNDRMNELVTAIAAA